MEVEEPAALFDEGDDRLLLSGVIQRRWSRLRAGRWRPSRRITRSWTAARFSAERALTSTVKWGTTPVASKTGRRPSSRWPGSWGWSPIRTRAWGCRRGPDAAVERGDRDGHLAVDGVDVLGRRRVVGHPDEEIGGETDLFGGRHAAGPGRCGSRPAGGARSGTAVVGRGARAAPRAEPGDDVPRLELFQPSQGRDPARCRCRPAARGPWTTRGPAKSTAYRQVDGPAARPADPSSGRKSTATEASPIGRASASSRKAEVRPHLRGRELRESPVRSEPG